MCSEAYPLLIPLLPIPLVRNKLSSFSKEVLCFMLLNLLHSFYIQLNFLITDDMVSSVSSLKGKCHVHLFRSSTHLQIIAIKSDYFYMFHPSIALTFRLSAFADTRCVVFLTMLHWFNTLRSLMCLSVVSEVI